MNNNFVDEKEEEPQNKKPSQTYFEHQQEEINLLSMVDQNIIQNIFFELVNGYQFGSNEEELKIIFDELLNFQITCKLFLTISNQTLFPLILNQIKLNLNYKKYLKILFTKRKIEKEPFFKEKNIDSIFYECCYLGYHDIINTLLKYGANINWASGSQYTGLIMATINGHQKTIQKLVKKEKLDINSCNKLQDTPLILSCYHGKLNTAKILLSRKDIDINKTQNEGKTALDVAKELNHLQIVELLENYQN